MTARPPSLRARDLGQVRRALLRAGTTAHYEDAAYYDQAYRRRRDDVAFYVDLATRARGPVLELGAGTGRVALAVARRGVSLVAVDLVPAMLARLRARLAREPAAVRARVTLRRGDLRRVRVGRRFPLVIAPFNVFMHLYDRRDVELALRTVLAHLAPGGRFVFDVLVPDPGALARDPARVYRLGYLRHPRDGRRYRYGESFDYDPVRQIQHVTFCFDDPLDDARSFVTPLTHRQFFPAELEALLHYNGLRVVERFGDFSGGPLDAASESQILVCDRRAARAAHPRPAPARPRPLAARSRRA
jgi:SAM-dependent methyltransferase